MAPESRAALLVHLLRRVVEPGGRVLVGPVYHADVEPALRVFARAGVPGPGVVTATDRNGKPRSVVWACASG